MCGRYPRTTSEEEFAWPYHISIPKQTDLPISYNIAPSQKVLTIRFNPQTRARSLDALQWGLIPYRAKDPKTVYRTMNARAEAVNQSGTEDVFRAGILDARTGRFSLIRAPQCGLAIPVKGLPTKVSFCTQDPESSLRQLTQFSGQSVGHRRMRYSLWRSAKRIASWLSLANPLRADPSESLVAMSWADEDTGTQSPNFGTSLRLAARLY
jgi:hypothetical protein